MRIFAPLLVAAMTLSSAAFAFEGQRTFMPSNNLHLEELEGGITEAQFNAVLDRVQDIYGPIISQFGGANLTIDRRWTDDTVNASAEQPSPTTWRINMYGGLARRPEVTEDGFAMVVCHELGHHIGGYPFVQQWAANEGQSDMHATGACATRIFATNPKLAGDAMEDLPGTLRAQCDANHEEMDREICYRAIVAGKSLANLLAELGNAGVVGYETPDANVVTRTNHSHPAAQCRLDTYIASALCGADSWDYNLIPGKSFGDRNSFDAQTEAFNHSCTEGAGARPQCWFAAIDENAPPAEECPYGDPQICALLCQLDPSQPWCN